MIVPPEPPRIVKFKFRAHSGTTHVTETPIVKFALIICVIGVAHAASDVWTEVAVEMVLVDGSVVVVVTDSGGVSVVVVVVIDSGGVSVIVIVVIDSGGVVVWTVVVPGVVIDAVGVVIELTEFVGPLHLVSVLSHVLVL